MTPRTDRWNAVRSRLGPELARARRPAIIVALAVLTAVASIALLAGRMNVRLPWEDVYQVRVAVDTAKAVKEGKQEVRWAGIVVGRITDVDLRNGSPVLTAAIDGDAVEGRLYRDATLRLRPQTALEDMYLDVESRGHRSAGALGDEEVLAAARTRTPVYVGEVMNVFSEDVRDRLEDLIDELARGLPDDGRQLRFAFAQAVPWLQQQARLMRTLADRRGITRRLVHNFRVVTGELADRDRAVTDLVRRGGATLGEIGEQRVSLDRLVRELPATLGQTRRSFERLEGTLDEVRPALVELRPAARALPSGLRALQDFARPALPALRSLRAPIAELTPLARHLAPTATSLASAFQRLSPQLPRLDRATAKLARCERSTQKFFAWTLSVLKTGNKENRTASPRGMFIADMAGNMPGVRDPSLRPIRGCADGLPAKGGSG